MFKFLGDNMKHKTFTLSLLLALNLVFLPIFSSQAADKNPPPKCEKCYRGPDGKMKCESVPCPK